MVIVSVRDSPRSKRAAILEAPAKSLEFDGVAADVAIVSLVAESL